MLPEVHWNTAVELNYVHTLKISFLITLTADLSAYLPFVIVFSLQTVCYWYEPLQPLIQTYCTEHWKAACECWSLSAAALPLSRWPTSAKLKFALKLSPTKWSICLQCHSNGRLISMNTSSGLLRRRGGLGHHFKNNIKIHFCFLDEMTLCPVC